MKKSLALVICFGTSIASVRAMQEQQWGAVSDPVLYDEQDWRSNPVVFVYEWPFRGQGRYVNTVLPKGYAAKNALEKSTVQEATSADYHVTLHTLTGSDIDARAYEGEGRETFQELYPPVRIFASMWKRQEQDSPLHLTSVAIAIKKQLDGKKVAQRLDSQTRFLSDSLPKTTEEWRKQTPECCALVHLYSFLNKIYLPPRGIEALYSLELLTNFEYRLARI